MSVPDLIRDAAMPPIDATAVRRLRFEVSVFLDEIARQATDTLEAVALARAKLGALERAVEGRDAVPMPTDDDTE